MKTENRVITHNGGGGLVITDSREAPLGVHRGGANLPAAHCDLPPLSTTQTHHRAAA